MSSLFLTSCYNSKISVGDISLNQPVIEVNCHRNDILLYGLVSLGSANKNAKEFVGEKDQYVVRNNITFLDGLICALTMGIYTPTTTTYYLPAFDYDYGFSNHPKNNEKVYGEPKVDTKDKVETIVGRSKVLDDDRSSDPSSTTILIRKSVDKKPKISPKQQKTQKDLRTKAELVSNGYNATVYFKDGAKLDGFVTDLESKDGIEIKLRNGLVIESKVKDIAKIEHK